MNVKIYILPMLLTLSWLLLHRRKRRQSDKYTGAHNVGCIVTNLCTQGKVLTYNVVFESAHKLHNLIRRHMNTFYNRTRMKKMQAKKSDKIFGWKFLMWQFIPFPICTSRGILRPEIFTENNLFVSLRKCTNAKDEDWVGRSFQKTNIHEYTFPLRRHLR